LITPSRAFSGRGDELIWVRVRLSDSKLADVKKKVGITHPKSNESTVDSGERSNFDGEWIGRQALYSS
jgi:hypothetical protein